MGLKKKNLRRRSSNHPRQTIAEFFFSPCNSPAMEHPWVHQKVGWSLPIPAPVAILSSTDSTRLTSTCLAAIWNYNGTSKKVTYSRSSHLWLSQQFSKVGWSKSGRLATSVLESCDHYLDIPRMDSVNQGQWGKPDLFNPHSDLVIYVTTTANRL